METLINATEMAANIDLLQYSLNYSYVSRFPNGWLRFGKVTTLSKQPSFSLLLGIQKPKTIANGIAHNDIGMHQFMIHISDVRHAEIELLVGGSIAVKATDTTRSFSNHKVGWRKKAGNLAEICTHFERYCEKLSKTVKEHGENLTVSAETIGF